MFSTGRTVLKNNINIYTKLRLMIHFIILIGIVEVSSYNTTYLRLLTFSKINIIFSKSIIRIWLKNDVDKRITFTGSNIWN